MKNINIIGAGITGSTLAYFLKDRFNVILYEKKNTGGLLATEKSLEGYLYQKGSQVLYTDKPWILQLFDKANVELKNITYTAAFHPLIDFKYYNIPLTNKEIEMMPWHWKEAIKQQLEKISGSNGDNVKELIQNFYGSTIFEIFYKGYIEKLTGISPNDVDNFSYFRRFLRPLSSNTNYYDKNNYFPINGYKKFFNFLLDGVDVRYEKATFKMFNANDIVIVTSAIDDFFEKDELIYRSGSFDIDSVLYDEGKPDTIIYPNYVPFVSMTQMGKLYEGDKNIIIRLYVGDKKEYDDVIYPIPSLKEEKKYKNFINQHIFEKMYLAGPLATYSFMSISECMESALKLAAKIKQLEG